MSRFTNSTATVGHRISLTFYSAKKFFKGVFPDSHTVTLDIVEATNSLETMTRRNVVNYDDDSEAGIRRQGDN